MREFAEGMGTAGRHWWCWSSHIAQDVEEVEETGSHGEDPFYFTNGWTLHQFFTDHGLGGWEGGCKVEV